MVKIGNQFLYYENLVYFQDLSINTYLINDKVSLRF